MWNLGAAALHRDLECGAAKWIPGTFSETQVILKVEATRKEQHFCRGSERQAAGAGST